MSRDQLAELLPSQGPTHSLSSSFFLNTSLKSQSHLIYTFGLQILHLPSDCFSPSVRVYQMLFPNTFRYFSNIAWILVSHKNLSSYRLSFAIKYQARHCVARSLTRSVQVVWGIQSSICRECRSNSNAIFLSMAANSALIKTIWAAAYTLIFSFGIVSNFCLRLIQYLGAGLMLN